MSVVEARQRLGRDRRRRSSLPRPRRRSACRVRRGRARSRQSSATLRPAKASPKAPARLMAASSPSCGAKPTSTCRAEGGEPVLKSRISTVPSRRRSMRSARPRRWNGPAGAAISRSPRYLGLALGDVANAPASQATNHLAIAREADRPDGMHVGKAFDLGKRLAAERDQPFLGARDRSACPASATNFPSASWISEPRSA